MNISNDINYLDAIAEEIARNHNDGLIPSDMISIVASRFITTLVEMPGYCNFNAIVANEFDGMSAEELLSDMVHKKLLVEAA